MSSQSDRAPASASTTESQRFLELLNLERDALRRADVHALEELQVAKKAVLAALRKRPQPADERREIQRMAQENIRLMQLLAQCLQGTFGAASPQSYGQRGEASRSIPGRRLHGRV